MEPPTGFAEVDTISAATNILKEKLSIIESEFQMISISTRVLSLELNLQRLIHSL